MKPMKHLLAAVLLAAASHAAAQFPNRPITIVVPFPPGATTDTIARIIAQQAATTLGKPVLVDNKPGAEGQLAAQDVAKAAPDGYRIMLGTAGNLAVVPASKKSPPYDVARDFTPIADVGRYQFFLYAHPSLPAKTFKEFIDYAKANPGKLSYATGNNTGVINMAGFRSAHGLDMLHVPYKGEPPAMVDLLAGRVQVMVASGIGFPHAREGKLKMLVALLPKRSPLAPDVPTLVEAGQKDLDVILFAGMVGPAGIPADVVARLNREFNAAMNNAEVNTQIEKLGFTLTPGPVNAFDAMLKDQLVVYRKAVREAGLPVE
ncbi:MAG: tripartite tricarboxylate transporter substrate binding protein [Betaproteobacteria bacterium]|nr:tripartite tricarboxylate transporter substrate binding protein [Betaproteobacteria bacterium]